MKPMRVYYDCEFLEDGKTVDLISIGMYREDGKEFYAVSSEFDMQAVAKNDWLLEHVMSSIPHVIGFGIQPITHRVVPEIYLEYGIGWTREQIKLGILDFVSDVWPEFWAWYSAYDHVALCQLFGRMIDLPRKFPMFTEDVKSLHKQAQRKVGGKIDMPKQPEGLHNALADAKFNKVRYDYLMSIINSK